MRATIHMAHDNTSLTVSQGEAARVEEDAKRRLLSTKQLSLVVDLDQTIIHATVDPTVGEWMEDKDNPNYDALSDVRSFQLIEDGPGMRGCHYYIKLRPGLERFLQNVSKNFELHIYTMGTRAYAKHIAEIIDPTGNLFGDRILSRDESGSLTAKNLQRLFPVDTRMVVIIDDRGDVWQWNPNLIKVAPYDFFVGIGDINSSFLPEQRELTSQAAQTATPPKSPPPKQPQQQQQQQVNGGAPKAEAGGADVSALEQLVSMGGGDNPGLLQQQSSAQEETIMHQVEDRPLLQKQKELDAEDVAESSSDSTTSVDESQESLRARHHLFEDGDRELDQLQERLGEVHRRFFEEYERRRTRALGGRVAALRGEKVLSKDKDVDLKVVPDVKDIMPQIKKPVMDGVVIVFSGVLPLGTDTQNADISLWAKSFGAVIGHKITPKTTHLVAGRNRTAKVREATRYPKVKIVTTQWLLDSLTQWKRLVEDPYLLPVHPEDRGEPISTTEESAWLSSSEEGREHATGDDDGGEDGQDQDQDQGQTEELNEDFQRTNEEIAKSSGLTDLSPIGIDFDERDEVHAELKEFLGSDDESESDNEFPIPPIPADQTTAAPGGTKRKRDDEAEKNGDGEGEGDGEEEEGKGNEDGAEDTPGSRLSQRIKRSYERSTGLKTVATADESTKGPLGMAESDAVGEGNKPEDVEEPENPARTDGDQNQDQDPSRQEGPENEADELEQEMIAAFDDGGYDKAAEESIAADNG